MQPGTRIGDYEIVALLGAGAMGEVYRAHDPRLQRDVAIKLLPADFVDDAQRIARFQREAQLLASLNHPNVAGVFELEVRDEKPYIVLELVDGEDLERIVARGPLDIDDALSIARQITEALGAAHDSGIIHRDLKAGNVKVTADGVVKVLDFGLAKLQGGEFILSGTSSSSSHTPTAIVQTQEGAIVGTPAYMSPEQARGKRIDKRTDIWAFGCVLWEMLAGARPFRGETASDTVAAILTQEPDWNSLPANLPLRIRVLLERCLTKGLQHRLRDIGDAWIEIDEVLSTPAAERTGATQSVAPASARGVGVASIAALAISALLFAASLWMSLQRTDDGAEPVRSLSVLLPDSAALETRRLGPADPVIAIAPDGSRIAYIANVGDNRQLALRELASPQVTLVPDTEGAKQPFFSPDGRWVGFFADAQLKKVPVGGGTPVRIAEAPSAWGGTWTNDGRIVFTPVDGSGLFIVPDDGGEDPIPLTQLDQARSEIAHDFPSLLPGTDNVLFSVFRSAGDEEVAMVSLGGGDIRYLFTRGAYPRYAPSGHLVYGSGTTLQVVPFDVSAGRVTGPPETVIRDLLTDEAGLFPLFDLSPTGVLVFAPGGPDIADRHLVWVDRRGQELGRLSDEGGEYGAPRLSPEGDRAAFIRASQLWILDIVRGTFSQLRIDGSAAAPHWSADGERLAFSLFRDVTMNVHIIPADGSGAAREALPADRPRLLSSWSPSGHMAFRQSDPVTGDDVWAVDLADNAQPVIIASTPAREDGGAISPDGRWIAYTSNDSGRDEVYVQPLPAPGRRWTISTGGGTEPVWSRDGRELFYRNDRAVMRVAIGSGASLDPGPPEFLFRGPFADGTPSYDVHPDGERFMMLSGGERRARPAELTVVLGWFRELEARLSAGVGR